MNLLICTQKIDKDDPILGFFHRWVEEFAKHCEQVIVVCLQKGEYNLPNNVKVLSLGKEEGHSKIKYLFNFYKYIWQERKNYDSVFVHMNQIYVILGGLLWKLLNKKIGLWYAHGHVPFTLFWAEKLSNIIFTSTASGFNLPSKKLRIMGQGIDINFFSPAAIKPLPGLQLITTGRLSPVKNIEVLLEAVKQVVSRKNLKLLIIGGPGSTKDEPYINKLKSLVKEYKIESQVEFLGPKKQEELLSYLQQANLFVSASQTGSVDKAILEAMSCGVPVFLANPRLPLKNVSLYKNSEDLTELILDFSSEKNSPEIIRQEVVENHSLTNLVTKFIKLY